MAHKKGGGSTKNGRNSNSKRYGMKKYGGEYIQAGHIIVTQLGNKIRPCLNVRQGKNYTIYSLVTGLVYFSKKKYVNVYHS
uniref:Ribosomal protein L27 n=1 Tax=Pterocladiophila hemisphaerica TaxID=2712948 RepID=A0A6M3WX28_9FLOR|nr:ribosomal protein L27 [Pterocladiophila hemisphaerica]